MMISRFNSRRLLDIPITCVSALIVLAASITAGCAEQKAVVEQPAKEKKKPAPLPIDRHLSRGRIEAGWIMLFEGESTFGWKVDGAVKFDAGVIQVGGDSRSGELTSTTAFGDFELSIVVGEVKGAGAELMLNGHPCKIPATPGEKTYRWSVDSASGKNVVTQAQPTTRSADLPGPSRMPITIRASSGTSLEIRAVHLKPLSLKPIFNGKDLTGWKPLADHKSVFEVNERGEINVTDGGGDLQSEGQWKDFILQLDVISNGDHLNSGIFFREIPGGFWQGYEAQIRNEWQGYSNKKEEADKPVDRTKPIDFGTGGLYNRQPSRKVVSSDHEWFTYTIIAEGPHIALWVNGYQTADFVDTAKDAQSARKGRYLGKGAIGLQGHDPTTNLSFRKIRIAELPEAKPAK